MAAETAWVDTSGLMAKSADKGGQTLAQHTWDVLSRLADQVRLRPDLPVVMQDSRLWDRLYWGCFLHDFGKAAAGFQTVLSGHESIWSSQRHRHEILSLGFVDWLFPAGDDRQWVIGVIACHHKDANNNQVMDYGGFKPLESMFEDELEILNERLDYLVDQIDMGVKTHLWNWLVACGGKWAETLGIPLRDIPALMPREQAIRTDLKQTILSALTEFHTWRKPFKGKAGLYAAFSRGLILTADHAASAGSAAFPTMPMDLGERIERAVNAKGTRRDHQSKAAESVAGSAILVSPTGSGKTEAALLWARAQINHQPSPRLFYTLPYQASMNAMADRLARDLFSQRLIDAENQTIAIQHSRATLKYYQAMMDSDDVPAARKAAQQAKALKDRARLNWYPIQVFSPYQMLKAAFQIKGYEAQLVDYSRALFIFDEIHAYNPERLALVLEMMRWLREQLGARFLIMTATLPSVIREKLEVVLDKPQLIEASPELYAQSQRHQVHLHAGDLLDQADLAYIDWRAGKSVLMCCNTVKRAQAVYDELKGKGLQHRDDVLLLHGRFNGLDRGQHEAHLMERVGVGQPRGKPLIIVATQVVEVSLNIDLDTLYTDPAPLEALLQRFGRVNRGRGVDAPLCPVHVFEEPSKDRETLPYDHRLVAGALSVLQERGGGQPFAIDEAQVTGMLDAIYADESIRTQWDTMYVEKAREMVTQLNAMVAYQSADETLKREFYRLFDGTQVLPTDCWDDYIRARDEGGWLAASQYLVNLSWGQYKMLEGRGKIKEREDKELAAHACAPYDSEYGLRLDEDTDE